MQQQTNQLIDLIEWRSDQDTLVTVTNQSDKLLFVSCCSEGVPLLDHSPAIGKNIGLKVLFYNLNGELINPETIDQGTDFKAVFEVRYTGIDRHHIISNMALSQIFPSGWEIINSRLYGEGYQQSGDQPDYLDIRDDRVNLFFDLGPNKAKRFEVLLNASYAGSYVLPAATVEAMYSDKFYARSKSKKVVVVKH
jgi:uncharacterized protein YfaS (alpha-2-macroglobulin family)